MKISEDKGRNKAKSIISSMRKTLKIEKTRVQKGYFKRKKRVECEVCLKELTIDDNGHKRKCLDCESKNLGRCKSCDKIFVSDGKRTKGNCKICDNESQKNKQRARASNVEGYLKQILSSIKNGKGRKVCEITIEDLLEVYNMQNGKCALTGIEMTLGDKRDGNKNPYSLSVDRIDNNIGYTKENIWMVLKAVNQFKNCYGLGDIFKMVRAMYEENGFSNSVE